MTCGTSYSQGPAQGYWFHPVGRSHQFLGLFGEWVANNSEERLVCSVFPVPHLFLPQTKGLPSPNSMVS